MLLIYGKIEDILEKDTENKKSAESAAGRMLLDVLLSRSGVASTSADIKIGKQGKPYLATLPNTDFNITHSNGFVACILSVDEGQVGIDAEPITTVIPDEKQKRLAARYFTDVERTTLESGERSFSELWTRREAFLKMTGDGFAKGIGREIPEDAFFTTLTLDGFILTACTEKQTDITVMEYNK